MKLCKRMLWSIAMICVAVPGFAADPRPSGEPLMTWRHLEQPRIDLLQPQIGWSPVLQETWLQCLLLDEKDLQREAADALALALSVGMPPRPEFREVLRKIFEDNTQPADSRVSAAQAYVAMGKPDDEIALSSAADDWPTALAVALEPALAAWDYRPLRTVWLQRLQAEHADPILVRIAVEALGTVREPMAESALRQLLQDVHQPFALRLVAARALSRLPSSNLVAVSQAMLDDPAAARMQWLLAIQLLDEQQSDAAQRLLTRFADLEDVAVAGEALRQLLRFAPQEVLARASQNIRSRDANMRAVTVEALATAPELESIPLLAIALQDPVLTTRRMARDELLKFAADPVLLPPVAEEVTKMLEGEDWRAIEQSLILLTKLQRRDVRQRVLQLLRHPRGEVMETAAWSLKELAVPQWRDTCLAVLQQHLDSLDEQPTSAQEAALMHLLETMGVLKVAESLELLRTFVPKDAPYMPEVRGAAVWAIGEVLQDQSNPTVVADLMSRLNDVSLFMPEYDIVRGMAAVSLGKMQAKEALEDLRGWKELYGLNSFIGGRSGWAIFKLTGEPIGEIEQPTSTLGGWAIQPLER